MSTEKITCNDAIKKLSEYRGSQSDAAVLARIDHARYIIEHISDDEVNKIDSLKSLVNLIDEKLHGKGSLLDDIDALLIKALQDLQKVEINSSDKYKAAAASNEVKKYTQGKTKRKAVSILFMVLFGCGAVITVVFAFLDNFQVIDYGGTAAGAAGIIDFVVGVVAFIVERVNDSNVTGSMKEAEKVHDSESFKSYKNISIKNSFHHIKIEDKRQYYGKSGENNEKK